MQLAGLREQQQYSHREKETQYSHREKAVENITEVNQSNLESEIPNLEIPDGFDFEIPDGAPILSNRSNVSGKSTQRFERGFQELNEHLIDVKKELYDSKRQAEVYKEKSFVLERVGREMQYDMEEMQKMIEVLNKSHKEKDKRSNALDLELQSIKFKLEKEAEEKDVSEKLCKQLRDQLEVIEGKLTKESETRQTLYLENQKQIHEIEAREKQITKYEVELRELMSTLECERNARSVQEEQLKDKLRQHDLCLMEVEKTSNNHAETVTKLGVADETRRQAESTNQLLQVELAQTKAELSRTQNLLDEYRSTSDGEVIKLREKLEDKTEKLGEVEKNLFQIQVQYENEQTKKSSLEEKIADHLQNESTNREKFEEEVMTLKRQLEKAKEDFDQLKDKFVSVEHERESVTLKMENQKTYFERDIAVAKEQLKVVEIKLADADTQIKILNEELKSAELKVTERTGDAANTSKLLEEAKSNVTLLEGNLREEKMVSNKFESKLETANEKISLLQTECDRLTKEIMSVKEEHATRDRSAHQKQDSVNLEISTLKENFNQERTEFILRNEQNSVLIEKLQNDLKASEGKLEEKTKELSKVMEEAKDAFHNINDEKTMVNAEMEKASGENLGLKDSLENVYKQLKTVTDEKKALQVQANDLKLELEKSKMVSAEMTDKLQRKLSEIENARLENVELKSNLDEMKKSKYAVEADLKEERARAGNARQDLADSNRARESLEGLLANIKGSNVNLEDQLNAEAFSRTQREKEVAEHRGLWESEVKSRSKIGMQVIELEKQVEDLKRELEEEKRRVRKAADSRKTSDDKNEIYEKRSVQHQQEVSTLKSKLKQYQRKLKECDGADSKVPAMRAEFDVERQAMSTNLAKLRRQLDQLSERLAHEQEMRDAEEKKNREQLKELTDLKTNEKVHAYEQERLERKCREFQEDFERQKTYYERNYFPADEIEEFKKALETKARLDLNKKLQEVNMHLEEQSLAREAFDKLRDGIEKKTKTGFEETVSQLKNDLTSVKACLHEGLVRRDTSLLEAQRFKELYESERSNADKLSDQLVKTNQRLSVERTRTNYLFDETMNKSKVTKKLFEESLEKDRKNSMSPRLQEDLGFSSYYRPKLWSTPVASTSKSPYTSPDPIASIKRRNMLS